MPNSIGVYLGDTNGIFATPTQLLYTNGRKNGITFDITDKYPNIVLGDMGMFCFVLTDGHEYLYAGDNPTEQSLRIALHGRELQQLTIDALGINVQQTEDRKSVV
jgi:hypothetical protein